MTTVAVLDVSRPLINEDGTPSPYFEEMWHTLTVCLAEIVAIQADHETRIYDLENP